MTKELNVNDVLNGLLERVGELARENALLKVQVDLLSREEQVEEEEVIDD